MGYRYTRWGHPGVLLGFLLLVWLTFLSVLTIIAWTVVYGGGVW